MSHRAYSTSESDPSEFRDNVYCIFLHIVEGIGLNLKRNTYDFEDCHKDKIILNASLNGVKFEVEGHSTETSTIFNSNCIWECELDDIKRMKTDNRPVKLECFLTAGFNGNTPCKNIGSLLLPIRGVQTIVSLNSVQLKLHWHKLGALSTEWRQNKPEIYLLLVIVKKTLVENGQFENLLGKNKNSPKNTLSPNKSETALMLQSQSNIYVQLLEQVGVIQVGNNPDIDCDIFNVCLTFKQVKHLDKLFELERSYNNQTNIFIFHYEFLGSASHLEINMNPSDCYAVNEKISLSFKSSLKSLRMYFERIFYIPVNLYLNGIAIANYRFDCSKFLPDDAFFHQNKLWIKNGTFFFDRLHKILSPRALKPSVDFIFTMQLVNSYSKKINNELVPFNETFVPYTSKNNDKLAAVLDEPNNSEQHIHTWSMSQTMAFQQQKTPANIENNTVVLSDRRNHQNNNVIIYEKNCIKANSEHSYRTEYKDVIYAKSCDELVKAANNEKQQFLTANRIEPKQPINSDCFCRCSCNVDRKLESTQTCALVPSNTISVGSTTEIEKKPEQYSIGINTEPIQPDTDELTLKIVEELEAWKAQQMEHFLSELERKESTYMAALDKEWMQQRNVLEARLQAKMEQCDELSAKLEKAHDEINSTANRHKDTLIVVENVKRDIERNYAQKFQMLDTQMQRLKMEMQQKGSIFEIQNKEVQIQNTKLERDKSELVDRVADLEKQLINMHKTHLYTDQLKTVLSDLHKTTERFAEMEKSKNYYKEQWAKTTYEMHKIKLCVLKEQDKNMRQKQNDSSEFDICLDDILNEEQDALKSERTDLKSIKEVLFSSSDTSSSAGDYDG